jgi:biofilm PGA synthesis lipoprotein PgaB
MAQSLPAFVAAYDMTAIMAMPQLDQQSDRLGWYRKLTAQVAAVPGAMERTLFEFATMNWRTKKPIPDLDLAARMREVQAQGARHIGYYPDDFLHNHPDLETIRPFISASDYPYPEPAR